MGAEKALLALGMVGRWQIFHYIMIGSLQSFPGASQSASVMFIGYAGHSFHCAAKPNKTLEESVPREDNNGSWSQCRQYKNYSYETEPCTAWNIDPHPLQSTTVSEWNMVCDKSLYMEITQFVYLVGMTLGCVTCVPFSDWFGRRPAFFVCQFLCCLYGICMAFSTSPYMLWAMEIMTGMFSTGNDFAGLILANELFPADMRVYTAPAMPIFGAIGASLFTFIAYFVRHWRELQLTVSTLPLLVLAYFYFCPESVRWLTANERINEAQQILDGAAKTNRMPPVPPHYLKDIDESVMENRTEGGAIITPTIRQYLSHGKTRLYYVVIAFCIFVTSLMRSSIVLLTLILPGDLFQNFAISTALSLPGVIFAMFSLHLFGRRKGLCGFLSISAATMLTAIFLQLFTEARMAVTAFTLLTRFSSQSAWGIEQLYVQELFPTGIRSQGLAITSLLGFCGYLVSPLALYLGRTFSLALPLGVIGGLVALAAGLCLLGPETLGRVLPTTNEEVLAWSRSLSPEDWEKIREERRRLWTKIRGKRTDKQHEVCSQPEHKGKTEMDFRSQGSKTGNNNPTFISDPCQI